MTTGMPPVYAEQSDVTLTIDFTDSAGASVSPDSASYRVLNEAGVELVASTALVVAGSSAEVTVPASVNALETGKTRAARQIELTMLVGGNTIKKSVLFLVESADIVLAYENSFQSFAQALLVSLDMPDLEIWWDKPDAERKRALIAAYRNISRLRFRVPVPSTIDVQSIEPYSHKEQGTYINEINLLTAAQFEALDDQFKSAVYQAQVAEADYLMNTESIEMKRKDMISETIGESSNFFRSSKPLDLIVSRKTSRILGRYLDYSVSIRR